MPELSPAARETYDAFNRVCLYNEPSFETDRKALAAALFALLQEKGAEIYDEDGRLVHFVVMQDDIRAIAAELEGAND